MSKETGTLEELDVKPGDVVECVCVKDGYKGVGEILTINENGLAQSERINVFLPALDRRYGRKYRIISRASEPQKVKIGDEVSVTTDAYHMREAVTLYCDGGNDGRDPMVIGTIVLEDGKPDRDSIKMEEL